VFLALIPSSHSVAAPQRSDYDGLRNSRLEKLPRIAHHGGTLEGHVAESILKLAGVLKCAKISQAIGHGLDTCSQIERADFRSPERSRRVLHLVRLSRLLESRHAIRPDTLRFDRTSVPGHGRPGSSVRQGLVAAPSAAARNPVDVNLWSRRAIQHFDVLRVEGGVGGIRRSVRQRLAADLRVPSRRQFIAVLILLVGAVFVALPGMRAGGNSVASAIGFFLAA